MSQQQKEKPKRAFRDLPIQITKNKDQGWQEDNGIYLLVSNLDYKDEHLTEDELKTFLTTQIADYKIPTIIYFTESLPLTKSNKLNREALKQNQRERQ